MFSSRTSWQRHSNRLSEVLDERKKQGKQVLDLTNSNPTDCGIVYPEKEILLAFSNPQLLSYQPDPHGLLSAREAVSNYYHKKNVVVDTSNIFLTASTSESYSLILKLLCNAGDRVLVPQPSYPLFEYLGQVNDVQLDHYQLRYDDEWHIDFDSLNKNISPKTKAIVLVDPHNPTGMFLKQDEYDKIVEIAKRHKTSLIVDEVFIDYPFSEVVRRLGSTAGETEVLTFTVNGISKSCGLPQMKLGWIIVSGGHKTVTEATERLEILCDTFLSVNTPVQVALPKLMDTAATVRPLILERVVSSYSMLQKSFRDTPCSVRASEGGWYGIIKIPKRKSDEDVALELLEKKGIHLHPGYFFDLEEGHLVVSLLTEEQTLRRALNEFADVV